MGVDFPLKYRDNKFHKHDNLKLCSLPESYRTTIVRYLSLNFKYIGFSILGAEN